MNPETAVLPEPPRFAPANLKPLLLLVGIAAAVAAGVTVVLWSRGPTYSMLYANLAMEDQATMAQALDAAGIPYRVDSAANALEVPAERLSEARLKLAAQGLPESDGGYATMEKNSGFGVSQFMESARYQHATELELARTIASLRPVEGARVHLAVPRQSAFVRDRRPASASVFVQLKAGRRLEQEQIRGIINLVASSIPELEADNVTVVDQQGRLLSSPQSNSEVALREQQFDLAHRIEEQYAQRIEALLTPLIGPGRVQAQVVAQMDLSVTEEAREQYRPESQIVRSEQLSEEASRNGMGNGGVPGSLTNQPPQGGVALPPGSGVNNVTNSAAPAAAAGSAAGAPGANNAASATPVAAPSPDNTSRQQTRNYEIDRTLAYTRQPAGRMKRITVAVLVDNLRTVGKDGKTKETPLTAEQLTRIEGLVKDAVGFDAARGDSVNVVNESFREEAITPEGELEGLPMWEQPWFRDMAKLLAGVIVLLVLLLAVVRPLIRNLMGPPKPAPPRLITETKVIPANENNLESLPPADTLAVSATQLNYEQQLAQARNLATQDPKRVAQVVRTWVGQDD